MQYTMISLLASVNPITIILIILALFFGVPFLIGIIKGIRNNMSNSSDVNPSQSNWTSQHAVTQQSVIDKSSTQQPAQHTSAQPTVHAQTSTSQQNANHTSLENMTESEYATAMKALCKPLSQDDYEIGYASDYFKTVSIYYKGAQKNVEFPASIDINGVTYAVDRILLNYSYSIENIIITSEKCEIGSDILQELRHIYLAPSVKNVTIRQSYMIYVAKHLQRVNRLDEFADLKEYLINNGGARVPCIKPLLTEENGLYYYNGAVVDAKESTLVYDSKNDSVINLSWLSKVHNLKTVIINANVAEIKLPEQSLSHISNFIIRNNPKYVFENNYLCEVGAKNKKIIFFAIGYQFESFVFPEDVTHLSIQLPPCVKTVVFTNPVVCESDAISCYSAKTVIVTNDKVQLKKSWFKAPSENGLVIYGSLTSAGNLAKMRKVVVKPLSEYSGPIELSIKQPATTTNIIETPAVVECQVDADKQVVTEQPAQEVIEQVTIEQSSQNIVEQVADQDSSQQVVVEQLPEQQGVSFDDVQVDSQDIISQEDESNIIDNDKKLTVLELIIKALQKLGGVAKYEDIYRTIEIISGKKLTPGQKAGIRKCVETHSSDSDAFQYEDLFYSAKGKGKGVWGLRNTSSVQQRSIISDQDSQEEVQQVVIEQTSELQIIGAVVENVPIQPQGVEIVQQQNISAGETLAKAQGVGLCKNESLIADVVLKLKVEKIIRLFVELYPEGKVFALDSLVPHQREALSKIAKQVGISHYSIILKNYGFEIITAEETVKLRNKVIYTPGNEPPIIAEKIKSMLTSLEKFYPSKVIEKSIQSSHSDLASKVSGLYQWLGYPSTKVFLAAYGYDYQVGDDVIVVDPEALVVDLKKRYQGKPQPKFIADIIRDHPDLERQLRKLSADGNKLVGMSASDYLVKNDILFNNEELRADKHRLLIEYYVAFIEKAHQKYPNGTSCKSAKIFLNENPDLYDDRKALHDGARLTTGMDLEECLIKEKLIIDPKMTEQQLSVFELDNTGTQIIKYIGEDTSVLIPAQIKVIDEAAFANSHIEKVIVAERSELCKISIGAFEGCSHLKIVDLSNCKKTVEFQERAFKNCTNLTEIFGHMHIRKIKEDAFTGDLNIFVQDGNYIYPRKWFYEVLSNGNQRWNFTIGEEIPDDCLPTVTMQCKYSPRLLDVMAFSVRIPIAATAGYGCVLVDCYYSEVLGNGYTAIDSGPVWTDFHLPTWESVEIFLSKFFKSIDKDWEWDTISTEQEYIELQREFFAKFEKYSNDRRAYNLVLHGFENLDINSDKIITTPARKFVDVHFFGKQRYSYNCPFDVNVGDYVYVDGVMKGHIGIVTSVDFEWSDADFMRLVNTAYRGTGEKIIFGDAMEHQKSIQKLIADADADLPRVSRSLSKPKGQVPSIEERKRDFVFIPANYDSFKLRELSEEEEELLAQSDDILQLPAKDNYISGETIISFLAHSTSLNGKLEISFCEGELKYQLYVVEYDGVEYGTLCARTGNSSYQTEESSIQIYAAKAVPENDGVRVTAVVCMHMRDRESSERYNGKKMPDGCNILAFRREGLTQDAIDAAARVLGDWVTKKKLPTSTPTNIKSIFLGLYDNFDCGMELEDEISQEDFLDEIAQYHSGDLDIEECSEYALCYINAINLAKHGFVIFVGPYTTADYMLLYNGLSGYYFPLVEGENGELSFNSELPDLAQKLIDENE